LKSVKLGQIEPHYLGAARLTVKFHDGRPQNVFKITKYTYANNNVSIDWLNADGKESVTIFAEFSAARWRSRGKERKPRRPFHRC
jgi:hypothetical protein